MVVIDEPRGTVMHSRHVLFDLESPDYRPLVDAQPPPPDNHGLWAFFDPPCVQPEEAKEAPVEAEEAGSELASSPSLSSPSQPSLEQSQSAASQDPNNSGALSPFQWSSQDNSISPSNIPLEIPLEVSPPEEFV